MRNNTPSKAFASPSSTKPFVILITYPMMKLQTLKFAVTFGSAFVWCLVILVDFCLFGEHKCFPDHRSIIVSLESFAFGDPSELIDEDENVDDLPKGLNHHTWEKNCARTIELLCNFPVFPKAPDTRRVINRTAILKRKDTATDAHRLFGFILPNSTGEYRFAVASNGFAEVWLGRTKNWRTAKMVVFMQPFYAKRILAGQEFNVSKTQISSEIHLKAKVRYYIEILYTLGRKDQMEHFVLVAWQRPKQPNFEIIKPEFLRQFLNDGAKGKYKMFDDELPDALSCFSSEERDHANKHMKPETLPYLGHDEVRRALQFCKYRPSYVLDPKAFLGRTFPRYSGVSRHVQKTRTFPLSFVDGIVQNKKARMPFIAEQPLDENEAWSVVFRYMDALETSYNR